MSTPFPLEESAQLNKIEPVWNPWSGPPTPHFFSGIGFTEDTAYLGPFYRALEAAGSGAAKGAAVLGGAMHGISGGLADLTKAEPGSYLRTLADQDAANEQDARDRVKAMTPDPATTGTAVQLLHSVGEGAYLMSTGALLGGAPAVAATVGGVEGGSRYQELREQGVTPGAAAGSAAVTAVTSAAGAVMPAAYGSTLATRLLTGAASNTGFGMVSRYADHKILEAAGYPEMAAQEKAWDGAQILTDAILGAGFGAIAHLHANAREAHELETLRSTPGVEDAARTVSVSMAVRQSAPGVATDPQASAAHQAALEKAQSDLLQGKPVDVSDSGVDQAAFVRRPPPDISEPEQVFAQALKESGFLDEEASLRDLEEQLAQRRGAASTTDSAPSISRKELENLEVSSIRKEPTIGSLPVVEDGRALAEQGPQDRLIHDSQLRSDLESMKSETGWAQKGGQLMRDATTDEVTGRTSWIPNAEWWPGRPGGFNEAQVSKIIDKALAGEKLGSKQKALVDYMAEVADARRKIEPYQPDEVDLHEGRLTESPDDANETAFVARAIALDEGKVESLAKQFEDDHVGFLGAIKHFLDYQDAAAVPGGEVGRETGESQGPVAAALADRPDLQITDSEGRPVLASEALSKVDDAAKTSEKELPAATQAAADCFSRRGG